MHAHILSRFTAEEVKQNNFFPIKAAVISFHDPDDDPVDFSWATDRVFYVSLPDLNFVDLCNCEGCYDSFFGEAEKVAEFVFDAEKNGYDIVCQCEYGESRSAGAAAAINEYFNRCGIKIFADYKYCPNQVVYNKLFKALCEKGCHRDE